MECIPYYIQLLQLSVLLAIHIGSDTYSIATTTVSPIFSLCVFARYNSSFLCLKKGNVRACV